MDKFKEIRPVALAVIVKDGKILASKCHDDVEGTTFYRCLGGGIEFLEKSEETLSRELMEEIGAKITIGEFLGISENIFTFNGKTGHELIVLRSASIDDDYYKDIYYMDGDKEHIVTWVDVELVKKQEVLFYPVEVLKYI